MSELRLSGGELHISNAEIMEKTQQLAEYYDCRYGEEDVVVLTVLYGASIFAHNLTNAMTAPNLVRDKLRVRSMSGTTRTAPELEQGPQLDLQGRKVLLVEDIDDTRNTLKFLLPRVWAMKPMQLDLVSLLNKPNAEKAIKELPANDVQYGFDVDNEFVVGHGLDWNQRTTGKELYRLLSHISIAHNIGGAEKNDEFWVPMVEDDPAGVLKLEDYPDLDPQMSACS